MYIQRGKACTMYSPDKDSLNVPPPHALRK
jgi:hypothetical protein